MQNSLMFSQDTVQNTEPTLILCRFFAGDDKYFLFCQMLSRVCILEFASRLLRHRSGCPGPVRVLTHFSSCLRPACMSDSPLIKAALSEKTAHP